MYNLTTLGKEGRRSLPVTAEQLDAYPHQLKENRIKRLNNRVQLWCFDNHKVKLLHCWESGEGFPVGPRCPGEVRITGRVCMVRSISEEHEGVRVEVCVVHVCARLFVTHSLRQDHTVLLVCGISRLKIAPVWEGDEDK